MADSSEPCCPHCGYATALPICPECGKNPAEWTPQSDPRLRLLRRLHLAAACLMLAWLIVLNAAFFAATIQLGQRPSPGNHPHATPLLELLNASLTAVVMIAVIAPAPLWWLIACRLETAPSGRVAAAVLIRTMAVCLVCWGATAFLTFADPLGAFDWLVD